MHVIRRKGWEIRASLTSPEALFLDRRSFLAGLGAAGAFAAWPARADDADPSAALYPAKRNPAYTLDRDVTPEKYNLNYNNFYEFSTSKHIDASALKTRPWTVKLDGLVEKEQTVDIDCADQGDGARGAPLSPPLRRGLVDGDPVDGLPAARNWSRSPSRSPRRPMSASRRSSTRRWRRGQRSFMPWPYVEGLTMAEATNDLAFVVTGAYGKPLAKVQGAPIRLATPMEIRLQVDQVDRQRFRSSTSGRRRSGRRSARTNTASGPTSTRTCRIRAGARPTRRSSTTANCVRR